MAISNIQPGGFYDINRDMYYSQEEQRRMYQMQEDEYRRAQMMAMQQQAYGGAIAGGRRNEIQRQNPVLIDPKDPLSFLSKADNKILLTGEAT